MSRFHSLLDHLAKSYVYAPKGLAPLWRVSGVTYNSVGINLGNQLKLIKPRKKKKSLHGVVEQCKTNIMPISNNSFQMCKIENDNVKHCNRNSTSSVLIFVSSFVPTFVSYKSKYHSHVFWERLIMRLVFFYRKLRSVVFK